MGKKAKPKRAAARRATSRFKSSRPVQLPFFSAPPLHQLLELSQSGAPDSKSHARPSGFSPISIGELSPHGGENEHLSERPFKPTADAPLPPPALSAPEMARLMARPSKSTSSKRDSAGKKNRPAASEARVRRPHAAGVRRSKPASRRRH